MNICLVTESVLPVKKYGGIERVVQWLASEYVSMGHKVTLVGPEGCYLPGVVCLVANTAQEAMRVIPNQSDFVHFHGWPPVGVFGLPWIFTLHGNSTSPEELPENTVCISSNHAQRHGKKVFVYNGIDPNEFEFKRNKENYLLFFSKVRRRVKGARRALHLAKVANEKLVVAGGYRLDLLKVGGLLDSLRAGVKFVGEIGGVQKAQYFANAKALLFPIDWEEPFGLVVIEALMSGTPVITTARGSMPELVNEKVGAFFDTDEEFASALKHISACSPEDCRQWAIENFSSKVCADNYLNLYLKVINKEVNF